MGKNTETFFHMKGKNAETFFHMKGKNAETVFHMKGKNAETVFHMKGKNADILSYKWEHIAYKSKEVLIRVIQQYKQLGKLSKT